MFRGFYPFVGGVQSEAHDARGAELLRLYFRVEGLDELAREVAARGAKILEGPVVRSYDVRELVVEDLNGFVLVFGEDVS